MAFSVILGEKPKLDIRKFAVRRIKRRKHFIILEKLVYSREHKNAREFWDVVNRNIKSKHSSPAPIVDGISGDKEIADLFALNLKNLLSISTFL